MKQYYSVNDIIMYLRKSRADSENETVEQVLERHENILQEYALKNYGKIIPPKNIFKEVASGETIKSRPEMQKILHIIATKNEYKAILVVEPQRLTRGDMLDCGTLIRVFKYNNIEILTPSKIFNLTDQYDLKYFQMTLQQGNEYLEYIKFILNRGRIASVKEGRYIGQKPPYGYDKIMQDKKFTLTPNKEADIVRLIFDLYVNKDFGCNMIAKELDSKKIKPHKAEYWSPGTIRDMLSNPVYIGKIRWNFKKTITTTDEFGNTKKSRPRNKDGEDLIVVDGLHPAIIDEKVFNKAQAKIGRNARIPGNHELKNPLATLIKCGNCGKSMSYRTYKDKNGNPRSNPRLLCNNQVHCHTASASYDEIENCLIEAFKSYIVDFKFKIKNDDNSSSELQTNVLNIMQKELETLENQQNKLYDFLERGIYSEEVFLKRNSSLIEQKNKLTAAIKLQKQDISRTTEYEEKIYKMSQAIEMLRKPEISAQLKNTFLKSFIKKIEYYTETDGKGNRWSENKFRLEVFF